MEVKVTDLQYHQISISFLMHFASWLNESRQDWKKPRQNDQANYMQTIIMGFAWHQIIDYLSYKSTYFLYKRRQIDLPAKDSKNQVEHKKRSDHNQWHKIDKVERTSQSVIGLQKK